MPNLKTTFMKNHPVFAVLFTTLMLNSCAQPKNHTIQVQVIHNDETYIDTTITGNSKEATLKIEELLSRYSTEAIQLDADHLHEIYVFNIDDKYWKPREDEIASFDENWYSQEQIEINIDSLFNKLSQTMEEQWREFNMDQTVDEIKKGTRELKEKTEPELQELKEELKEMIEKIKTTRVIIIQKGDTIKVK
ncbi:MAG TPA: hypothetical protein DCQ26_18235 [Marinilabiliales bacterium]|nr:MAG: hypothetical protein A2W95_06860 [Bacteroidetes bacterium GWA2_40_14]OFZ24665.1 MAG: hypothetical protein A2437_03680 [Bacteroidetes bacterium RIFOXYC2_FULL_40_12]HAN00537.1 hypothetical protein [Marinilabiliales bacterium]HAZ01401.1 hypothetical protein [Marinilabiliales bacterium]HBO73496.1 hypothetical protein [Marinilabiliales bacterium]